MQANAAVQNTGQWMAAQSNNSDNFSQFSKISGDVTTASYPGSSN